VNIPTLSELKRSTLYSIIKNILSILSKLKCFRFSALDYLCLNEAKLLCLAFIAFVYDFQLFL